MPKLETRKTKLGLLLLVAAVLVGVLPAGAQQAAELLEVGGEPTLLFRVGHQHKAFPKFTWCFGNLYVSQNAIRYEVTDSEGGGEAARYRDHGFSASRTQVTEVKRWYNGVEIRLRQGKPYHLHVYSPGPGAAARGGFIQPEPLLEALDNFEAALARVQPPPKPPAETTATLTVVSHPVGAQLFLNDELRGATGSEGVLRLAGLPPGAYRIRLSLPGFEEWRTEIKLESSERRTLEVQLAALKPAAPPPPDPRLSLDAVIKLLEGGVTPARVESIVKERGVSFELTDDAERKLRALGATDALLLAIAKAKK